MNSGRHSEASQRPHSTISVTLAIDALAERPVDIVTEKVLKFRMQMGDSPTRRDNGHESLDRLGDDKHHVSICGRVVDSSGKPLPGVQLQLVPHLDQHRVSTDGATFRSVSTDRRLLPQRLERSNAKGWKENRITAGRHFFLPRLPGRRLIFWMPRTNGRVYRLSRPFNRIGRLWENVQKTENRMKDIKSACSEVVSSSSK